VRIHLVMAARPNFMKVAPLWHELCRHPWAEPTLVHTGQHYDAALSDAFLADLGLPRPHHMLGIGSGTHAEQTGGVMIAYERVLMAERPDLCVVAGDVNSTVACALAAVKLLIPVAHLEAGLRSGDRTMPEEINRIVTDAIADLLWTPSADADANLKREGIPASRIRCVGNIMIDSLEMLRPRILQAKTVERFDLDPGAFGVATLHRPSNVDTPEALRAVLGALRAVAGEMPVVFPVHPRTRKNAAAFGLSGLLEDAPGLITCEPLSYMEFMNLVLAARFAVTDSGGLQEETTYLGIPCFTLRRNTERPITVELGTNRLVTAATLADEVHAGLAAGRAVHASIPLWDGKTAARIAESLEAGGAAP
jgi:UDP-N-acetylglucosamine 2-epimerase (non-hydrolysing)